MPQSLFSLHKETMCVPISNQRTLRKLYVFQSLVSLSHGAMWVQISIQLILWNVYMYQYTMESMYVPISIQHTLRFEAMRVQIPGVGIKML